MDKTDIIIKRFEEAKKEFESFNINVDAVVQTVLETPISLHNWLDEDIIGFEEAKNLANHHLITGHYSGTAQSGNDIRSDLDMAISCIPSKTKLNLHTMYAEPQKPTSRNELKTEDFRNWIDWAKKNNCGIDINASYFTRQYIDDGFSLASDKKEIRDFWIECAIRNRNIAQEIGKELGIVCVNNLWIPDGMKDLPANRFKYREHLLDSLNQIFAVSHNKKYMRDVLDAKLFNASVESFTVASYDFYLAYAAQRGLGLTFGDIRSVPTKTVIDSISSVHSLVDCIQLYISQGIHGNKADLTTSAGQNTVLTDELVSIMNELKRGDLLHKNVYLGLDFFDATINRVSEWVLGARSVGKALLTALLEPTYLLFEAEENQDYTMRLILMEEFKQLPISAVWDYICLKTNSGVGTEWIDRIKQYEQEVLKNR